jgi:hypothetical protein
MPFIRGREWQVIFDDAAIEEAARVLYARVTRMGHPYEGIRFDDLRPEMRDAVIADVRYVIEAYEVAKP